MLLLQNLGTAVEQLWANKLRSLLTVLGVVIGVMSTLVVAAAIEGYSNYVAGMLREMGTNAIWVYPGAPPGYFDQAGRADLTLDDLGEVDRGCPAVRRSSPFVVWEATVKFQDRDTKTEFQGTAPEFQSIRNMYVEHGRYFGPVEIQNRLPVCVVGKEVLNNLRTDEGILGRHVYINGHRFEVIGVLEAKGSLLGRSLDNVIQAPYTAALDLFPESARAVPFMVEAAGPDQVAEAQAQVVTVLRRRHQLGPGQANDFRVVTQDEIVRTFDRVRTIAAFVLVAVVGVSLLVGGIGITNVMLVSVTERTREIGLRKALGARRRDILAQFLTEAAVLSAIGGVLGIGLGYAITFTLRLHPAMAEVNVPGWAVLLGLGFSMGVGIVFGILPAAKAAMLQPIDALRHE